MAEDGVEVGRAHVTITADGRPAVRQVGRDFDRGMPDVGRKAGGHLGGGIFAAASKFAAPVAALFAVDKIIDFGKESVGAASDLNEAGTKVQQIFGKDGAKALDQFAKGSARNLGQTKLQVLDAASTFGVFGKAAGLGGRDLVKFSSGFDQLSTDMASFFNTSPDQAMEAIAAGLRGESEPLRKYGVLLDDASLRQEALKQGLIKTTKQALTPQQKVLAAQALIYKQTKDAQGDFARTSGGLANQQRILTAQVGELKTRLGTALLPIAIKVVSFFNRNLGPAVDFVAGVFGKVQAFVTPLGVRLGALASQGAPATGFLRGQLLPALMGIVSAGQRLAAVVFPIVRQIAAEFMRRWPVIRPLVVGIFKTIGGIVTDVMALIKNRIQLITGVIRFIWSHWGKQITQIAGDAFQRAWTIISGVMKIIGGIVKTITGIMTGDWRKAGEGIKAIVRGFMDVVVGLIRNSPLGRAAAELLGKVRDSFKSGVDKIAAAWDALKEKAKEPIRFVINTVINNGLIAAFNKIARIIPGVSELPDVSVGFARGGLLPGFTPVSRGDDVLTPMRRGEGVSVSEAMRDPFERARLLALNAWALAGKPIAAFRQGYAGGGLVGGAGSFTPRFAAILEQAQRIFGGTFQIFQRGFRPATSYSGTSHAGDAVDLAPATALVVKILRSLGVASWRRGPGFPGNFPTAHIHGVPLPGFGQAGGQGISQAQNYLAGGDGLGGRDYEARGGVLAKIGELIKSGFSSFVDWFKGLIKDPLAKLAGIAGSPLGQLAAGVPRLVVEGLTSKLKGYAAGTSYAAPGWAVVGEHGAELVNFGGGGQQVFNSRDTSRMLGRGGITITGGTFGHRLEDIAPLVLREVDRKAALNPVFAA